MIFVVISENAEELQKLTDLLIRAFPGCVVYRYLQPADAAHCIRTHEIHAVFLDAAQVSAMSLVRQVRAIDRALSIIVCANDDISLDEALWNGADHYLIRPLTVPQLTAALHHGRS